MIDRLITKCYIPIVITKLIFELQTLDFAWTFVWIVPTNNTKL